MALTKADIINNAHSQLVITKSKSAELVETLLGLIKDSLENGEDVLISGFGKFSVKKKNKRRGRNLATGEALMLKPRKVVKFRCSRKLRKAINKT